MVNRRFLRIKVMQAIYAYRQSKESDMQKAERQLSNSIDKLYELFIYQLSFFVEVKLFAERRIEENKHKNYPTEEDLNPNLKFVNNRVLNALQNNRHLLSLEEKYKINWAEHREDFIRGFYNKMLNFTEYQEYMGNGKDTFGDDRGFLLTLVDKYMPEDGVLYDFYADRDLAFNSDYPLALYLLWRFVNDMPAAFGEQSRLPMAYTQDGMADEDERFALKLFELTVLRSDEYAAIIERNIDNWDFDRLALMDVILISMAITEFTDFHFIPVKVTINEYIEISKYYSTTDSRRFVNGLLDKIATELKEEGRLVKKGPGLIDK